MNGLLRSSAAWHDERRPETPESCRSGLSKQLPRKACRWSGSRHSATRPDKVCRDRSCGIVEDRPLREPAVEIPNAAPIDAIAIEEHHKTVRSPRASRGRNRSSPASHRQISRETRRDEVATVRCTPCGTSRPPGSQSLQMQPAFLHHGFKTRNLRRQHAASKRAEPVVAPPGIIARSHFVHQAVLQQALQIVVKSPRPELIPAFRLPRNLLHNPVAVQLLTGQRKQNMKSRRSKRKKVIRSIHTQLPLYQIPTIPTRCSTGIPACVAFVLGGADASSATGPPV